jgi:hypothetical protein
MRIIATGAPSRFVGGLIIALFPARAEAARERIEAAYFYIK